MRYKKIVTLSLLFALSACVYEPEQFVASDSVSSSSRDASEIGTLYPVNLNIPKGCKQICNPSVSQDTVNYPASMLWLNFSGTLCVKAPDSIYTLSKVIQHDRLSVSDTAGNVLWYLMRDTDAGDCLFQDPEWSTHPGFIVALRAFNSKGGKGCKESDLDYGMFAVRMSDKKKFFFYDKDISELATPHLWVESGAEPDTGATDATVEGFFGTKQVRLVYVNKKDQIVFVDFANGGLKKAKILKKPSGVDDWMMDSPLISPDGHFVVYNVIEPSMLVWRSFVQELSGNSNPIEIEKTSTMMSEPVQPHWFSYRGRLFVEWTEFPQGSPFLNRNDLSNPSVQDGSAGRTAMREISLVSGAPSDLAFAWVGDVVEIAPVPMIGGRSPDGRFLAAGTNYGYLLELP